MTAETLADACRRAIEAGHTPGAVALVGTADETLCHIAAGDRAVLPSREPMLPDTIFDLASVTKPVATATAILTLVDSGLLGLRDPVSMYVPWPDEAAAPQATISHLLTHTSGLPPWLDYAGKMAALGLDDTARREAIVEDIARLPRHSPPGARFVYTCLGYIVLADILRRVTGCRLDDFCRRVLFEPLGTAQMQFNPPPEVRSLCAATEPLPEGVLLGVVHDENARFLSGVGGNAGLFGTADDLARFCRMLLRDGEVAGGRVLSPAALHLMTSPRSHTLRVPDPPDTASPAEGVDTRGLGWDIDTDYSPSLRGDLFSPRSFGHSGYTGTSVWIDPDLGGFLILLTNRVHFGRDATVQRLRYETANIAAAMLSSRGRP